ECGVSALHLAARCGDYSVVERLIKDGASVDLRTAQDPKRTTSLMTPLHFAAEGGHANIVKLLIHHGASPHATNESGSTPFFRAERSGSLKTLKVLHEAGSDLDTQNSA
ncbi:ankyrin repeat protein, partial [Cadophora sp. MPI-SDFR-AT-0126]